MSGSEKWAKAGTAALTALLMRVSLDKGCLFGFCCRVVCLGVWFAEDLGLIFRADLTGWQVFGLVRLSECRSVCSDFI